MPDNSSAALVYSATARQMLVVDYRNLLILWLEEKIARHELSEQEADRMMQEQETQEKLWIGPTKDGSGNFKILSKLADNYGSIIKARVRFTKSSAGHDLVIFEGWAKGRSTITGTRYRTDNLKIIEMQIGKPGLRAAAKESARFGLYLVVAIDIADYLINDRTTLGHLLGELTVDMPSVLISSAVGVAVGSFFATTTLPGLAVVGTLAFGPLLMAFAAGIAAGVVLWRIDEHFHLTDRVGEAYDRGLLALRAVWDELDHQAEARYEQLIHSHVVNDLRQQTTRLANRIGVEGDWISKDVVSLW